MTVKTQKTVKILAQYIWGGGLAPKPLIPAAYGPAAPAGMSN